LGDDSILVPVKGRHVDDGVVGEVEVYDIEHDMMYASLKVMGSEMLLL
jgi:hypothetical protein